MEYAVLQSEVTADAAGIADLEAGMKAGRIQIAVERPAVVW
jgi:hypothetical protein